MFFFFFFKPVIGTGMGSQLHHSAVLYVNLLDCGALIMPLGEF